MTGFLKSPRQNVINKLNTTNEAYPTNIDIKRGDMQKKYLPNGFKS